MTTVIRNCRFAFKCDKKWEDLPPTKVKDVRFCHSCQQEIYFCRTAAQLHEAIVINRCVAVEFEGADKQSTYVVGFVDDDFS